MTETKLIPFSSDVKLDYQGRTIEGYAATFGNVDLVNDIIHPNAFAKTLVERGGKVKFLWQHDTKVPLGRVLEMNEDANGLYFKAVISDTQQGRDALALLRDNAIEGMSIGYEPIVSDFSKYDGKTVRNLRELKLHEISLVTFPASPLAGVTALKDAEPEPEPEQAAPTKEWTAGGPVRRLGDVLQGGIHQQFTNTADAYYQMGYMNTAERIALSGAIGSALETFVAQMPQELAIRSLDGPYSNGAVAVMAADDPAETKAGRIIAKRNAVRLKTIRKLLQELVDDGGLELDDDEEPEAPAKRAAEDKPASKAETPEAGPDAITVAPPTFDIRALELEIESETLRLLEV